MRGDNKSDPTSWNRAETLDRLGGDEELLQELVEIFVKESPRQLLKLREAIECWDADATMRAGHSIKGELACLGGASASALAQEIETMGKNEELSGAGEAFSRLELELVAFTALLREPSPLPS